jgi:hypothetical protein
MLTGQSGGFLAVAERVVADMKKARNREQRRLRAANDGHAIAIR